ncbi:MAG: hypothetical protein WD069_17445 [Planctomycetales bacterium]
MRAMRLSCCLPCVLLASGFAGSALFHAMVTGPPALRAAEPPAPPAVAEAAVPAEDQPPGIGGIAGELTYTTYFYTAGEAIIHGFENDTNVRIISMDKQGTVFSGKIDRLQTKLVPTGSGVFGFVSNKKASILVGTPSSCAVVGFWLRDQDGNFRSNQLFTQLPSSHGHSPDCRVVVWAWEDVQLDVNDFTADKIVSSVKLEAGKYHEIAGAALDGLDNHVLNFEADKKAISVQVYYDEGFFVPAENGSGAGRLFRTYVGKITEGKNDLNLISYYVPAQVRVEDANSGELLFAGEVKNGGIHTLTLEGRHVKVASDVDICVLVAPYEHYKTNYAEHHFGVGGEGTGIETEFLLTTPGELWVFSYYPQNDVRVIEVATGRQVFAGTLGAGDVRGVHPGHGFFRVLSGKGVGTMGGALACGAEFSPASNQFSVDEALFQVVQEIREQRAAEAARQGITPSGPELDAPLSADELKQANEAVRDRTGRGNYTDAEVNDRLKAIQQQQRERK